jgi:basic membrane protein A
MVLVLALGLVLTACGKKEEPKPNAEPEKPKLRVALIINGTFGDKGFFDSAKRGVEMAEKELGLVWKATEAGNNPAEWEPAARAAAASGEYDIVIAGTYQMTDHIAKLAKEYPNVKFIFFDDVVPGDLPNVYSVTYAQNEGSFLAGAFAALVTTSKDAKLPNVNDKKVVGFIGGMDIPVINDFKVGYEAGAQYIDKDVKVLVSYVGNFFDVAKGKELSLAQFNQGADIGFNVAGGAGLGLLEASKTANKYSIGVDSNQNPLYPGFVLTSMLKNVDASLLRALKLHTEGQLTYGKAETIGIKEGAVGLATDDLYEQYVPQDIKDKMKTIIDDFNAGKITVPTVFK